MIEIKSLVKEVVSALPTNDQVIINSAIDSIPQNLITEFNDVINTNCSQEKLLLELGNSAGAGLYGIDPKQEARKILNNYKSAIKDSICTYQPIRVYANSQNLKDTSVIAGLILGGLVAAKTAGVNLVLISIITANIGLRSFCDQIWKDSPDMND